MKKKQFNAVLIYFVNTLKTESIIDYQIYISRDSFEITFFFVRT